MSDSEASSPDDPLEQVIADAIRTSKKSNEEELSSDELFLIPLARRPFFPGMAAPIVIEQGTYYEVLKQVAASEHKTMGLFLTRNEDANIYALDYGDFYNVGVSARILRIIPMEQGGAQVILNMEKRITIKRPMKRSKYLKAKVSYHIDKPSKKLSKELKAYSISITFLMLFSRDRTPASRA